MSQLHKIDVTFLHNTPTPGFINCRITVKADANEYHYNAAFHETQLDDFQLIWASLGHALKHAIKKHPSATVADTFTMSIATREDGELDYRISKDEASPLPINKTIEVGRDKKIPFFYPVLTTMDTLDLVELQAELRKSDNYSDKRFLQAVLWELKNREQQGESE
jgi:hypothetical protein